MIADANGLSGGRPIEADVCIAGAGAAGITLASALRASGLRVCLLESGGFTPDRETQSLYEGEMLGLRGWHPHNTRLRTFGGSTQHWDGWCRPMLEDDFEVRDWIPHSGWPIGFDDLAPFYERAQRTLQLGGFGYDPASVSRSTALPLLPLEASRVETRIYQFSPPTRFGEVYRSSLADADDIEVYLRANVVDIALSDRGFRRVSHLECQTLGGKRFRVAADRFVLALGGLENARLLLAADSQRSDGVANGSDSVGCFFMEHPHYYASTVALLNSRLDLRLYERFKARIGDVEVPCRGAIGLALGVRAQEGLPSFSATLGPSPPANEGTGPLGLDTIGALTGRAANEHAALRFSIRCEQTPLRESRVTLGSSRDALGMPRLAVDWRIRDADHIAMRRSWEVIGAELARLGLGRIWIPTEAGRFRWKRRPGAHHMGTTRMGTDPRISVVDESCRCHDVENLYIAGSSVFTTSGDANPTLTIVALAHRLADHLKDTRP